LNVPSNPDGITKPSGRTTPASWPLAIMLRSCPRHPVSVVANWLGGVPFGGGWTSAKAIPAGAAKATVATATVAAR